MRSTTNYTRLRYTYDVDNLDVDHFTRSCIHALYSSLYEYRIHFLFFIFYSLDTRTMVTKTNAQMSSQHRGES